MSEVWGDFWEIPEGQWRWGVFDLPCLWGKEAWEDSFLFFFFQRIGIALFLRLLGWLVEIQLRLIATGGPPVELTYFLMIYSIFGGWGPPHSTEAILLLHDFLNETRPILKEDGLVASRVTYLYWFPFEMKANVTFWIGQVRGPFTSMKGNCRCEFPKGWMRHSSMVCR